MNISSCSNGALISLRQDKHRVSSAADHLIINYRRLMQHSVKEFVARIAVGLYPANTQRRGR